MLKVKYKSFSEIIKCKNYKTGDMCTPQMIHACTQKQTNSTKCLLFHHVVIHEGWHEGDGESAWTLTEDISNILVLEANNILSIDFSQVVINENTVPTE